LTGRVPMPALFVIRETFVVLLVVSFFYLPQLNAVEFHVDESHWIGTSYMYESYVRGRFWSDTWKESHETITNPPVPRYVIGLGRSLGGYRRGDINRIWQYDRDYAFNVSRGAMPSDGLLWWSRFPMAILAVASIWMAFWVVKKVAGRVAGYFWIVLATANTFLLLHTRRAMAESPILFFVMLASVFTCLATDRLTRQGPGTASAEASIAGSASAERRWKTWLYLGVVGLSIGLAGGSKLNGLAVLGVPFLCIGAALYRRRVSMWSSLTEFAALGVLLIAVTGVTFLSSYPYFWPDLWERPIHMFTNRVEEMRVQAEVFPDKRIDTWARRREVMPTRILSDYASFPFRGAIYVNGALVVLGACVTTFAIRDWLRKRGQGSAPVVFVTSAVAACAPTAFTIVEWDRYYLFPVFFSSMTCAIALGWLVQRLVAIFRVSRGG
jgi:Dolichyl-phosphate-mannose-protein mannosyltransferase